MTKEAIEKFGSIYQFGVEYMEGFNQDADTFVTAYRQSEQEIKDNGYAKQWNEWKENNQDLIIRLYDALNAANKIPTGPVS